VDDFQPFDNFMPSDAQVWITQALAERLWPGESALGREFWMSDYHLRVAGVLAHFARPNPGRSEDGVASSEWSVIVPAASDSQSGSYVLRAEALDMPQVIQAARKAVAQVVPEAVLNQSGSRSLSELRENHFRSDRAMTWLLIAVIVTMLLVTALGIVGLSSFWVQQRTRQIGVRRALGATRGQILRYFQTENFLITSAGIMLGMLLAFGTSQLLMMKFELPRLPWIYLPAGALSLWILGQLAVLWPARRAAAVPPAVATRSV
jgi:putative ABC transport system permease protein